MMFLNFFTSNDQIYIQTVKFEFKQTNQKVTPHYNPLASAADGHACAIYRAVALGPTPTRALPLALTGLKLYRPLSPLGRSEQMLPPEVLALRLAVGTGLNINEVLESHWLSLCWNLIGDSLAFIKSKLLKTQLFRTNFV
jgi:hypothetical protein